MSIKIEKRKTIKKTTAFVFALMAAKHWGLLKQSGVVSGNVFLHFSPNLGVGFSKSGYSL